MPAKVNDGSYQSRQIGLFLEEICSELCRFKHVVEDGLHPDLVKVHREVDLGGLDRFADIQVYVKADDTKPYFLEVEFGYTADELMRSVVRKYGKTVELTSGADRLILLLLACEIPDRSAFEKDLQSKLHDNLQLETWDEEDFKSLIQKRFGITIEGIGNDDLLKVRRAIDQSKWERAMGADDAQHPLAQSLMWHFSDWTLRRLKTENPNLRPEDVLKPGRYQKVAILMADLSGFSSYVRNTHDQSISRDCLSIFYSAARYAIHNAGGMLYQFVGDEAVGIFGVPDRQPGYNRAALDCARALIEVGNSVSTRWQKELDFLQESKGLHVGIGTGSLDLLLFRPLSKDYIGFVGDAMNLTARLTKAAGPNEIVVSNVFYQQLDQSECERFERMEPVDAKNVGRVMCWKIPAQRGVR